MAALNAEYGSELHLLRMLGRHREFFNRKILDATGADELAWRDFPGGGVRKKKKRNVWDEEWEQLNFLLPDDDPASAAWARTWPTHKGPHWDAIGRLSFLGNNPEWLLIEAKANLEELTSDCSAEKPSSLKLIRDAFVATKEKLGVAASGDWLSGHYQYCNRLVALDILNRYHSPARLAYIYFYGDISGKGRNCPASEAEWKDALRDRDDHVGLPSGHPLEKRIHHIFIDAQMRTESTERGVSVPYCVENGKKKDERLWREILGDENPSGC